MDLTFTSFLHFCYKYLYTSLKFRYIMFNLEFNFLFLILQSHFISNISGYIDPASGTLALQMIAGAIIGFGIAIKIYWYKLKEKFSRKK